MGFRRRAIDVPDASPTPASSPPPSYPAHLGNIALLCLALLGAAFVGALVDVFVDRAAAPLLQALARTLDIAGPVAAAAALAAMLASFQHALGHGMARRRRIVRVRRRLRAWSWTVHLLWIPVIAIMVFAEGWVLLVALGLPLIVGALVWFAAMISKRARRPDKASFAFAVVVGLALGLFA